MPGPMYLFRFRGKTRRWVALSQEGLRPKLCGGGNLEDASGNLEPRTSFRPHFYLQASIQSASPTRSQGAGNIAYPWDGPQSKRPKLRVRP